MFSENRAGGGKCDETDVYEKRARDAFRKRRQWRRAMARYRHGGREFLQPLSILSFHCLSIVSAALAVGSSSWSLRAVNLLSRSASIVANSFSLFRANSPEGGAVLV